MSIIVKQDEINQLIYRYLLESGFKHTAFTFYSEGSLGPLEQNIQTLPPRLLVNFLEKGLIYHSLETHIYKNELQKCNEPFLLTSKHECKTEEKKKVEKIAQLNNYNYEVNQILQETQPEGAAFESTYTVMAHTRKVQEIVLSPQGDYIATCGEGEGYILIWKVKRDAEHAGHLIEIDRMIPIHNANGKHRSPVKYMWDVIIFRLGYKFQPLPKGLGENFLIILKNGEVSIYDSSKNLSNLFSIREGFSPSMVQWNPNNNYRLSLGYEDKLIILDPFKKEIIDLVNDKTKAFEWIGAELYSYLTLDDMIYVRDSYAKQTVQVYSADKGTDKAAWNKQKIFLASFSSATNAIKVWILQEKSHLYNIDDPEKIQSFQWNDSEDKEDSQFFNFLIIQFLRSYKIFDIEFGTIKYKVELEEKLQIKSFTLATRNQSVVSCLEDGTIQVHALSTQKKLTTYQNAGVIKKMSKVDSQFLIGSLLENIVLIDLRKVIP